MGLFDFLRNGSSKKQMLLEWQKLVMLENSDRLVMSEQQLRQVSIQQAQNDLRIMNDCKNLVMTTVKPEVFFSRINLMVEKWTGMELNKRAKYDRGRFCALQRAKHVEGLSCTHGGEMPKSG